MQIPWLFPDFFPIFIFSLTFNKIPWLFPDFCQVWNFPDFSLTAGHPVHSSPLWSTATDRTFLASKNSLHKQEKHGCSWLEMEANEKANLIYRPQMKIYCHQNFIWVCTKTRVTRWSTQIITRWVDRHADNWSHPGHYLVDPYTWPWSPNGHGHEWPTATPFVKCQSALPFWDTAISKFDQDDPWSRLCV